LNDLIDDNPIEDESDSESDADAAGVKRKRDDDDELDDQLCEEDLELLEENTGVKFKV
jgi:Acidic N-terminal SPT6